MDIHLLNIDAITLKGLSRTRQRKAALLLTLIIAGSVISMAVYLVSIISSQQSELCVIIILIASSIHYIIKGRVLLLDIAWALLEITPLGVLYRHDKRILNRCRYHLKQVTDQYELGDYLGYSRVNPTINSKESLEVIRRQRTGNLEGWVKHPVHLKHSANLIYQIYLVERLIENSDIEISRP